MQYDGLAALKWGDKFLRHSVGSLSLSVYLYFELMHPQVKSRMMVDYIPSTQSEQCIPTPVPPKAEENPDPVPVVRTQNGD